MKKIYLLLAICTVLSSCKSFLDIKPAGKLIPPKGDVASFDKLLNNNVTLRVIYENNNGESILPYLCDDIEMSDNQANHAWYDGHPNIDCYFGHIFKLPYDNPATFDSYWTYGLYAAAQYFNTCINGVRRNLTPDNQKQGMETMAQATVARAWGYFTASLGYGPVYKPKGDNSKRVLPYRESDDVMSPMEDLSTLQEIYDKVLLDIHTSLPYIPDNSHSNARFGKVQTYAFLAYYHLFTANYDSVAFYADKSLKLAAAQNGGVENLFYDMNLFSWANTMVATEPDARYVSSINTSQGSIDLSDTRMREICLFRDAPFVRNNQSYPSKEFLSLFDFNTDLRCQYFFFEYDGYKTAVQGKLYDDGRRIMNYQYKIGRTVGYSYPEVLLMRAEGRARTGDLQGALADLNYLRKFRHKKGTPALAISGSDNIINEIINERRRELPVASYKRFADLKRFTNELGKPWARESITHVVKGVSYTQKIDSEYYVLPIKNTVLKWNPQWGIPMDDRPWSSNK